MWSHSRMTRSTGMDFAPVMAHWALAPGSAPGPICTVPEGAWEGEAHPGGVPSLMRML